MFALCAAMVCAGGWVACNGAVCDEPGHGALQAFNTVLWIGAFLLAVLR
jgi:hypothetical protein